jgi:hypothetical protein
MWLAFGYRFAYVHRLGASSRLCYPSWDAIAFGNERFARVFHVQASSPPSSHSNGKSTPSIAATLYIVITSPLKHIHRQSSIQAVSIPTI